MVSGALIKYKRTQVVLWLQQELQCWGVSDFVGIQNPLTCHVAIDERKE